MLGGFGEGQAGILFRQIAPGIVHRGEIVPVRIHTAVVVLGERIELADHVTLVAFAGPMPVRRLEGLAVPLQEDRAAHVSQPSADG